MKHLFEYLTYQFRYQFAHSFDFIMRSPTFNIFRRVTFAADENEVIVYDPVSHELRKDSSGQVKDNSEYKEIDIPRFGKKVDVFLNIGPKDARTDRYLATVNLNSLGFTMNIKRHMGELKSIYVHKGEGELLT